MKDAIRIAAIDIGTNSFHLAVVRVGVNGQTEVLGKEKEMVRLGSGAEDLNHITGDAMDRGISVLQRFKKIAQSHNATIRAVATSAVREAYNRDDFIEKVRNECGLEIEVISGTEEARLIYLGILQAIPVYDKRILMIDIGGGSTEFLVGFQGNPLFSISQKLGAIRLTDRFFRSEPINGEMVKSCRQYIRVFLAPMIAELREHSWDLAIASSGTAETIHEMVHLSGDNEYREGYIASRSLDRIVSNLINASTIAKRARLPGLDEKRADIIVGGAILLQEIFNILNISEMRLSPFALREGVIHDTVKRESESHESLASIRRPAVIQLLRRSLSDHPDEERSANHIADLSLQLYDELWKTGFIKKFDEEDRELLEYAALLHNIGLSISYSSHHKHSYYIIRNSDTLTGFTRLEQEIIAQVARYHRKSPPTRKHETFISLPEESRKKVFTLAAILRTAVNLDRGRKDNVRSISLTRNGKTLRIELTPGNDHDLSLELWATDMKKDMLEELVKMDVEFSLK